MSLAIPACDTWEPRPGDTAICGSCGLRRYTSLPCIKHAGLLTQTQYFVSAPGNHSSPGLKATGFSGTLINMSRSKCSRDLYCSFLEVTSDRYSALALSEVVPPYAELSHDSISRWLAAEKVQPKDLWAAAKHEVAGSSGILVFDDVVIDKSRSGKTELVNWQYAGSKHDITKGIGVVNALWQTSKDQYIPMDYRICRA